MNDINDAIAEEDEEAEELCFALVGECVTRLRLPSSILTTTRTRNHNACPSSSRVSSAPGIIGTGGGCNVSTSSDGHMIVETYFDYGFNGRLIVVKESL